MNGRQTDRGMDSLHKAVKSRLEIHVEKGERKERALTGMVMCERGI